MILIQCTPLEDGFDNISNGVEDQVILDGQFFDNGENPFIKVSEQPISTFSVDADGASYAIMRRYMNSNLLFPVAAVRVEEFINYFTFDYKEPTSGEQVSLDSEITTCPWDKDHHLMRIGMKGASMPIASQPYSNFVFLIDVSGSMKSSDKLDLLKTGFKTLVDNLRDYDKVAIVTYAGQAGVLLESTWGSKKAEIKQAIDKLGAGGSTAGSEGIKTAYDIAQANFIVNGNNRVIMGTDGDFNVGISSTTELIALIEAERKKGIYLTMLGVGIDNLQDHRMEQLADKGNGNYEYIDDVSQIQKVFINEISKFYTVAKDAKIQISFNPSMVESYRLIGYENRKLNNQDFEDDTTDAGEIGAGQTITALYEIQLVQNAKNQNCAQFDFRYKKPNEEESRLITEGIEMSPVEIQFASENTRFAASVAGFGMLLKDSQYKGDLDKAMVLELAHDALTFDPFGYRNEFVDIVSQWRE